MGDLIRATLNTIENRFAGIDGHDVGTGFHDLDELLGGLQPGSLTVLAGRPAVGKTTMALAVATNAARDSTVLFATNESSAQHMAARVIAAEAAVNGTRMRDGRLRERDWRAIGRAVDITGDLELHVADNIVTLDGLRAAALELIEQHGQLRLIVLDRLDPLLINTRRKALAATARLAHDLSVPLFAITAARSTKPDRSDRAPGDVAGNDVVIEAADAMMLLDPSISPDRALSTMDVRVVTNRFGPTGTIRLAMQTSVPLVRNAARPSDEAATLEDADPAEIDNPIARH